MIKTLTVKNFKSLKELKLECKKINVFIGKPNTGKSNILESIGIFSAPYASLQDLVRFEYMNNLFFDQNVNERIHIKADESFCEIKFENGQFKGVVEGDKSKAPLNFSFTYDNTGVGGSGYSGSPLSLFKFYKFKMLQKFPKTEADFLRPVSGNNLLTILVAHKTMQKIVKDLFSDFGLKVVLRQHEGVMEVQKEIDDVIVSYPYSLISDTLQRVVFHLAAIETNKNSVIVFEEPEAHAFPYYTKFLAEAVAMDDSNQYFITTHNPYFLLAILEKAPKNDVGIFITYFEDYQTKIRTLQEKQIQELYDLEASLFLNLDHFITRE